MKKEYLNEIWKPIKGYEGLYEVSNLGRVKSIRFGKEKIMSSKAKGNKYLKIMLCKNKTYKRFYIHRLVAQAFLEIPEELRHLEGTRYLQVNHKDENPQNNIVTNLEWCDAKYNNNYGTARQRMAEKQSKPVLQYTLDGEFVKEWKSMRECGRNNFSVKCIKLCCNNIQKYHKGYIWKYKE